MGELGAEKGDITRYAVDAIVNAANMHLAEGGGVCGAIFVCFGDNVLRVCQAARAA